MFLMSISAGPLGRFLNPQSDGTIAAVSPLPIVATEFLVSVLGRPEADTIRNGDRLCIRSVANNLVWEMDPAGRNPILLRSPDLPRFGAIVFGVRVIFADLARSGVAGIPCILAMDAEIGGMIVGESFLTDIFGGPEPTATYGAREIGLDTASKVALNRRRRLYRDSGRPFEPVTLRETGIPTERMFRLVPHGVRTHLSLPDGRVLRFASDQVQPMPASTAPRNAFDMVNSRFPLARKLYDGDSVCLRDQPSGRLLGITTAPGRGTELASTLPFSSSVFRVARRRGSGELRDGDEFTLHVFPAEGAPPSRLAASPGAVDPRAIVLSAQGSPAPGTDVLKFEPTKDLTLFFNPVAQDFVSTTAANPGSPLVRRGLQARVRMSPALNDVPLRVFFHSGRGDTLTTATEAGAETARDNGYVYRGIEGFVSAEPKPDSVPLKVYWNESRQDHVLAARREEEQEAANSGYRFLWLDSYAYPDNRIVVAPPRIAPGVVRPGTGPSLGTPPRRPLRALVLSGGGAKGCFEVGALKYLMSRPDFYTDIVCGVSVGAVNGAKVAEGTAEAMRELEELWVGSASFRGQLIHTDHYLTVLGKLFERLAGRGVDSAIAGLLGFLAGGPVLGPITAPVLGPLDVVPGMSVVGGFGTGGLLGAFSGLLLGAGASGLDHSAVRVINLVLTLFHSLHSMQPLRWQIRRSLDPAALQRSGIQLRMGITDVKSGQFFTVTGPERHWAGGLEQFGRVEVEPDHATGPSWLSNPIYGADGYVMSLHDAIYASATLPVFMEPPVADLTGCDVVTDGGRRYARIPTGDTTPLIPGLDRLAGATAPRIGERYLESVDWNRVETILDEIARTLPEANPAMISKLARLAADGTRGRQSAMRILFDGGLRDTMPIRTAMRMGAREIIVITGDRLQSAAHVYGEPVRLDSAQAEGVLRLLFNFSGAFAGLSLFGIPLFQHLLALLGIWYNEAARTDVLLGVARNEFLIWLQRAAARMDEPNRRAFLDDLDRYWQTQGGREMYEALGTSSWLGGRPGEWPYGRPGTSEGATISYIAPDRDLLSALAFEDENAVRDGIELGYRAAQYPRRISA